MAKCLVDQEEVSDASLPSYGDGSFAEGTAPNDSSEPAHLMHTIQNAHIPSRYEAYTNGAATNGTGSNFVMNSEALLQEYRQLERQRHDNHQAVSTKRGEDVAEPIDDMSTGTKTSCVPKKPQSQAVRSHHRDSIAAVRAMVTQSKNQFAGASGPEAVNESRNAGHRAIAPPTTTDISAELLSNEDSNVRAAAISKAEVRA